MSTAGIDKVVGHDRMSQWFLRFAEQTAGSNMYQFLSRKVAYDTELLKLTETANESQPVPNLFFAAVNFLLYKDPSHPLAKYYPNHSGVTFSEDNFFEIFKDFCLSHSSKIAEVMKSRLVQTNEVRRCALFLPALAQIPSSEVALIDVGTSSGLNLLLDSYGYKYSNGLAAGDPKSELNITCEVRGKDFQVSKLPKITQRIGIDLNPIDLTNNDEVLWTLSLVWPDQIERVERLKAAIKILNKSTVELQKGDGNALLQEISTGIPKNTGICVMHSFTLNQFSAEARLQFDKSLCTISSEHDVWRISLEWIGTESPELELFHYVGGKILQKKRLATCHQHGEWINWL